MAIAVALQALLVVTARPLDAADLETALASASIGEVAEALQGHPEAARKVAQDTELARRVISLLKAEQMTKGELLAFDVDEIVEDVGFHVSKSGSASAYDWKNVPEADVVGMMNWDEFAGDNTSNDGFFGDLDAGAQGLKNQYYLVRSIVKSDNHGVADKLSGAVLEASSGGPGGIYSYAADTSGKKTAQWWHERNVLFQVKIDAVPPMVKNRKPIR